MGLFNEDFYYIVSFTIISAILICLYVSILIFKVRKCTNYNQIEYIEINGYLQRC